MHGAGATLYYNGANLNAVMGRSRPGDMGFDIVHYNLHKTFSQPHGGGGPGAGPVAVRETIAPFLPAPVVVRDGETYRLDHDRPKSIGRVRGFAGPFGVFVRAYAFMRSYVPGSARCLRSPSSTRTTSSRCSGTTTTSRTTGTACTSSCSTRTLKRAHGITALAASSPWYAAIGEFWPLVFSGRQPVKLELRLAAIAFGLTPLSVDTRARRKL